jgi:hypothetical protein
MTAEPELPPITCPSSLVGSCAPLLGFEPADCVVVFVHGVPRRQGPILVRMDLGRGEEAEDRARALARGIVGTDGVAVDVVAFVPAQDDATVASLPSGPVLGALLVALMRADVMVGACLSTNGRVWWSHLCPEPDCCKDAEPLDESVLTMVRAEYAFAGYAPVASRGEIAARVLPDPMGREAVERVLLRARPAQRTEPWRDRQILDLDRLLVPRRSLGGSRSVAGSPEVPPARVARALRALADIRVRDTVLLRLVRADDQGPRSWDRPLEVLSHLVRQAPPGTVAPPATLLAIVAWMCGEGALANAALDRSAADDPHYRLASLARQLMVNGVDPASWRLAMAGLSESECRGGGTGAP